LEKLKELVKDILLYSFVTIAGAVLILIALEAITRLIIGAPRVPEDVNWSAIALSDSERVTSQSYHNETWASDFVQESNTVPNPGLVYKPFVLWRHLPYKTKYVTYDQDGYRVGAGTEESTCRTRKVIFVFGGSTIAGDGIIRDEDLLTTLLYQRLKEQKRHVCWVIKNYGQSGFNQGNEFVELMLLLSKGNRPDFVIFYDGANDALYRVYFGRPHMAHETFQRAVRPRSGLVGSVLHPLIRHSSLLSYLVPSRESGEERALRAVDLDTVKERARHVAELYAGNIGFTAGLGQYMGFQTMLVLQPNLFSKDKLSFEESRLLEATRSKLPLMEEAFHHTYEAILGKESAVSRCRCVVDLRTVFDQAGGSQFVDMIHVSPAGNRLVAHELSRQVLTRFPE
jgi:hypothetical protein